MTKAFRLPVKVPSVKINIHTVGWVVLVISVIISIFVRTPFGFFDEQVHYVRALGVGGGQLLSYSEDGSDIRVGHDIDKSSNQYMNHYMGDKNAVSIDWWADSVGDVNLSGDDTYVINTSAAPYTPIPYLSYAAASALAQPFSAAVKTELVMMRLFGALVSLTLVALAFRISPKKYKWTILAIALIPMSVAAFASISTDGFTISATLLFMAVIANILAKVKDKPLRKRDILLIGGVAFLAITAKMPLFLLVALVLCLMVVTWGKTSRYQKLGLSGVIILSAVTTLAWAYYAKDINTGAFWGRDVDTVEQLQYIAREPITFIKNLSFSVLNYNYINIPYNMYSNSHHYGSMPFVVDVIILAGVLLSSFVSARQLKPSKAQRWMYWAQIGLAAIICVAIFILLYLQFTPVGTPDKIDGVQPRYFLPLLVLVAMNPYVMRLSTGWRRFVYATPFIGIATYLGFFVIQLM